MRFVIVLICSVAISACVGSRDSTLPRPVIEDAIPIFTVQGSGRESPFVNRDVTVTGIVTGDFQVGDANAQDGLGGFFLQDETGDGDVLTSDGVFVEDNSLGVDVRVGDRLLVSGHVAERSGETRIIAASVGLIGSGSIEPAPLTLPAANIVTNGDGVMIADLESLEGMLIRLPQTLTVTDVYDLERFGSLLLSVDGRIEQFTNRSRPDSSGYQIHRHKVVRSTLIVDDGSVEENRSPPRYLFPHGNGTRQALRVGDTVTSLEGNLHYGRGSDSAGFENFRLVPVADPEFVPDGIRSAQPPAVGGTIRVMSFNALNFFTTPDIGQDICGPTGSSGCRGADSGSELARQRSKLATAILAAGPDIVGLMEIENNPRDSLSEIVAALNQRSGSVDWSFVDTGALGSDAIRVGFVYNARRMATSGPHAVLDGSIDARFNDQKNRPALAQTFVSSANGARLTIVVNHLKSKGSNCDDLGDPDVGDGQGNCSITRTRAAMALADWLAGDPTGSGDADMLIVGDLNAYLREDPLLALEASGFVNAVERFVGPGAYSFVFRGESGALDHALASPSLLPQVSGAAEWHINADEPPILDYNLDRGRNADFFDAATPFRASDHDPVIVGLDLLPD